jgi:hypothetical protein
MLVYRPTKQAHHAALRDALLPGYILPKKQ